MARQHWFGLVLLLFGLACEEDAACPPLVVQSDKACETTADCVEEGFTNLQCVNSICALGCVSDIDCVLSASPECQVEQGLPPPTVCERQLCQLACPAAPCVAGESCIDGRCVVAAEDFEGTGQSVITLDGLGWNQLASPEVVPLSNPNVRVVAAGEAGCVLGDDDCAGVAASGARFVVLGTQATTEKGTARLAPTCRPCACCLECQLEPGDYGVAGDIYQQCPFSSAVPAPLTCPSSIPAACAQVCADCDQCEAAPAQRGTANLVSCEATAAAKTCSSCAGCDGEACRSCRDGVCQQACSGGLGTASCTQCEAMQCPTCTECRTCEVCDEARSCELVDPSAAECRARRLACDGLGLDGCYPTPIRYDRSQLSELEQALVSPAVDLSGRGGRLILSFAYVPFGVAERYFESRQGVPASMWRQRDQELVVELCGANCAQDASWQEGLRPDGERASVPPLERRNNGLSLGKQSEVDWRSGRVEVMIPNALRTSTFRYRFLPRLDAQAVVGVDNIRIRSEP